MIAGIMAGQVWQAPTVPATARPVFVASVDSAVFGVGALTVALPAGWAAGQLALLRVVSYGASITTPAGWTQVGTELVSTDGKDVLFWRILQTGDSGPTLSSSTNVVAIVWTFSTDTFNAAVPVSEIATRTSAGALSTGHTIPNSSSVTAGEHYVMHFDGWSGTFASVSSYPYASAQATRGHGSTPNATRNSGCGQNFDGGVSAGVNFTVSANTVWTSRKVAIIGKGYSA